MLRINASSQLPRSLQSTRRSFLQVGSLGVAGLSLASLEKLRANGNADPAKRQNSVILLWLSGGPGHMETWDPKPQAPVEFRGPLTAIETNVPGIQLGELMPEQAKIMDQLAILRTVNHGTGDHTKGNHWMLTGFEGPAFNAPDNRIQRRPSMGSVASQVLRVNNPGMTPYVAVPHLRGGTDNLFHYSAYLGGGTDPFIVNSDPNEKNYRVRNLAMASNLSLDRLSNRRTLLSDLDHYRSAVTPAMNNLEEHQQAAYDLLLSKKVRDAFDISLEPDTLRDAYGRHTFGQSALVARRLVEHDVPFVTVNCVPWDHHGSANRYTLMEGANKLIPPLDIAIAALVKDLIDRGLYEKTLIVAMGEFGRTPRVNKHAGRDHWGNTFSVLMGCGSMKMGQTIGTSSARGERVDDRPIDPQDIAATIYHHLGINPYTTIFHDYLDRPLSLLDHGKAIQELIG